ncbi:OmpA family protein [Leadbetterella sp. DM7]|uniref:OmpA family protein n=1 Tax=Leadbetterella sp. DM7 TaxID=3235085 RepID=UPI00349ECE51
MKGFLLFVFTALFAYPAVSQVTPNPPVERKSAKNVFINKIEITSEYTVFHMQFYDKSDEGDFDRFMKENPEIGRRLKDMGLDRGQALKMFRDRMSMGQTISFQPGSRIVLPDGRQFKFIKAVNIPVSPERQEVETGKKYFFKVYFERIPAGFEKIDLIEYDADAEGTFQYWNFNGIKINNPKDRKPAPDSPVEEPVLKAEDFRVYGRILNAATGEPINAKIICSGKGTGEVIDSLQTSRTGKYEFYVNENEVSFDVSAPGFAPLTEALNLRLFLKSGSFEKDIYVEPDAREAAEEEPAVTEDTPPAAIGERLNEEATAFKLDKVYFNLGQAVILQESYEQLDNLAAYLNAHPDLKIQVEGHTDNQGDPAANQKLSLERAFNVRRYLVEKGVDGKRIRFKGYGSSRPVSPNDTEENRSRNRRVEYKIVNN